LYRRKKRRRGKGDKERYGVGKNEKDIGEEERETET
jgi:hypothetical protein